MNQTIKKGTLLLTAALLLCSLTACAGKSSTLQLVEAPAEEPEYLSFFSPESLVGSDVGKYWSERFAETYGRKVSINYDGAAYYSDSGLSYRELLERRLESTMPDDLYIINAEDVLEFGRKGYWMDLSGMDFVNDLSDAALYQSTFQGKVFSLPLAFTGFGFYWNVDLLEEFGLAVPENLKEFLAVCETLKAEGILPYGANKGYALTVPAMCAGLSSLYGSAGTQERINGLNSGETPISDYMHDGFTFVSMLIDRGYLDPDQAMSATPGVDDMELFLSGRCGFITTSLGVAQSDPAAGAFGAALTGLPVLPDGSIAVYGADTRLCVNPKSEHLETALEFIEMVGAPKALDMSAKLNHTMSSARNSTLEGVSGEEPICELLRSPGQIPNQDFSLYFNTWEGIRDVCREICKGMETEDACAALDALQKADLDAYSEKPN